MKKIVFGLVIMATLVSGVVVMAGWEHQNSKTYWVNAAAPATCWARDEYNDVYAVDEVQVYQDTIRLFKGSNTNIVIHCGFWTVDTSEDFVAVSTTATMYSNRNDSAQLKDVEWTIDSSGDLVLKQ
jgi:hypothetical protein